VTTNNKGEKTSSIAFSPFCESSCGSSFPTNSWENPPSIPQNTFAAPFSNFQNPQMPRSKHIFFLPAIFDSKAIISTKDNIVQGTLNQDKIEIEIIFAADFNIDTIEKYSFQLVIEEHLFPYEFMLTDELMLSTDTENFKLKPTNVEKLVKTNTKVQTCNNETIQSVNKAFFKALVFGITKEEMDKIINSNKLSISLSFSSGILNVDLLAPNIEIMHEFAQVLNSVSD